MEAGRKPRLRLVKVVTQATFVLDDGESLVEQVANPVTVAASEWPGYPNGRFLEQVAALEAELTGAAESEE
jgi:hypothetical protein